MEPTRADAPGSLLQLSSAMLPIGLLSCRGRGWDQTQNWGETLSGGEKQRLAMVSLQQQQHAVQLPDCWHPSNMFFSVDHSSHIPEREVKGVRAPYEFGRLPANAQSEEIEATSISTPSMIDWIHVAGSPPVPQPHVCHTGRVHISCAPLPLLALHCFVLSDCSQLDVEPISCCQNQAGCLCI